MLLAVLAFPLQIPLVKLFLPLEQSALLLLDLHGIAQGFRGCYFAPSREKLAYVNRPLNDGVAGNKSRESRVAAKPVEVGILRRVVAFCGLGKLHAEPGRGAVEEMKPAGYLPANVYVRCEGRRVTSEPAAAYKCAEDQVPDRRVEHCDPLQTVLAIREDVFLRLDDAITLFRFRRRRLDRLALCLNDRRFDGAVGRSVPPCVFVYLTRQVPLPGRINRFP